jgi:hypothetical protein
MRFSKALGPAALAAMAGMAFLSASTASADDEMVLCTVLVNNADELCPVPTAILAKGTTLTALASAPAILLPGLPAVKCEDGIIEGELNSSMGAELPFTAKNIAFGKLPTPTLGEGCSVCTKGIHAAPVGAAFEVAASDDFFFRFETANLVLKGCTFGTCEYSSGKFKSLIDRDAQEHPDWPEKKKDVILVKQSLTRVGGGFCPATAEWFGEYILTLSRLKPTDNPNLFYVALEEL